MSRYRWAILAVGVAAQMAVAALRSGLPALGPALRHEFGLSLPQLGLILGSVSIGIVLTLIPWGALADRSGERLVLTLGLLGTALALVLASFAPDYGSLLAALVVAGMFGASATGASGRAVMGWFGRSERGMALGIRQTGVPLGGGIAAIALPLMASGWSLRGALLGLAAGCVVAAFAAWAWMREPPPVAAHIPPLIAPPPLRDRRLWRLASGSGMLVVAQSSMLGFIVIFFHDERGWSPAAAAAVLAAVQAGGSVMRVMVGRWSDRRHERVAPVRILAVGASCLLAIAATLTTAPAVLLVPVLVAAGVLSMSWNGLSFTAAAEMSGRQRAGTAISVQNTILSAAGAVAPFGFALLIVATSWPVAWAALVGFQLGGVVLLGRLVPEERSRRRDRDRVLAAAAAAAPRERVAAGA